MTGAFPATHSSHPREHWAPEPAVRQTFGTRALTQPGEVVLSGQGSQLLGKRGGGLLVDENAFALAADLGLS